MNRILNRVRSDADDALDAAAEMGPLPFAGLLFSWALASGIGMALWEPPYTGQKAALVLGVAFAWALAFYTGSHFGLATRRVAEARERAEGVDA